MRRVIPEPVEIERRFGNLVEAYRIRMGANGIPVLHEESIAFIATQLEQVRNGCVSDPEGGLFRQAGGLVFVAGDREIHVPAWRSLMGESQLAGFRPLQEVVLRSTHVGGELGHAQIKDAALRWNHREAGT